MIDQMNREIGPQWLSQSRLGLRGYADQGSFSGVSNPNPRIANYDYSYVIVNRTEIPTTEEKFLTKHLNNTMTWEWNQIFTAVVILSYIIGKYFV